MARRRKLNRGGLRVPPKRPAARPSSRPDGMQGESNGNGHTAPPPPTNGNGNGSAHGNGNGHTNGNGHAPAGEPPKAPPAAPPVPSPPPPEPPAPTAPPTAASESPAPGALPPPPDAPPPDPIAAGEADRTAETTATAEAGDTAEPGAAPETTDAAEPGDAVQATDASATHDEAAEAPAAAAETAIDGETGASAEAPVGANASDGEASEAPAEADLSGHRQAPEAPVTAEAPVADDGEGEASEASGGSGERNGEQSPMNAPPDAAFVGSFGSAVKAGEAPADPPVRRPRRSDAHLGVDLALRTLVVPPHVDSFWDDLALRVADEPQLRLRPRAAVRPITQPPPIVDDRVLFADGARGPSPRAQRRRRILIGAVVAVAAFAVIGLVTNRDEGTDTAGTGDDAGAPTTEAAAPTTTAAAPGTPAPAPTTPAPPPVDPAAPITPNAVGRLPIPASARDLTNSGFFLQVDQRTFDASGGTCYDARIPGVGDLLLRFRSPDPTVGIADQGDGVLATVTIDAGVGSPRLTDAGFGLGTPEEQVRAAYGEAVEELPHPFVTGGHILRIPNPDGNGNGVAYFTDGRVVTAIAVGQYDVIAVPDGCV